MYVHFEFYDFLYLIIYTAYFIRYGTDAMDYKLRDIPSMGQKFQ